MDVYIKAIIQIIKEQELVIGPLALDQAKKVTSLQLMNINDVKITGSPKQALADLVERYAELFGQASVEVCKEAIRQIKDQIPQQELPQILK